MGKHFLFRYGLWLLFRIWYCYFETSFKLLLILFHADVNQTTIILLTFQWIFKQNVLKTNIYIYTVNGENSYILEWTNGTLLSSGYCDVQFHGKGEETLDDYKVCFEALEYSIEDCEVHMQYRDTTNLPYDKVLRSDISIRQLPCSRHRLGNNVAHIF